jgi:hypothetical protein
VEFYERRGWAALGYGSWRAWAEARLGHHERTAYKELTAGIIERELLPHGANLGEIPERQLRPLASLRNNPDALRETWADAHERAEQRGETFTARHVAEAVEARKAPAEAPRDLQKFKRAAPGPRRSGGHARLSTRCRPRSYYHHHHPPAQPASNEPRAAGPAARCAGRGGP